ncbi:MAG: acyl--CoA ligase [Gammaproteobacteria bacterium]|nr:acyl--CoA ligase [Gammaproteobacteria bacterium]
MTAKHQWHWNIPEFFNIGAACTDLHLGSPIARRIAMIVADDRRGSSTLHYAELAKRSSQFAQLLRNLDIDPGERVLVRLPNCLDYPVAFLGTMKRGAVAVPTSTLLVAEEVRYLLEDSGAAVLVTHGEMWPELRQALEGLTGLRHIILTGGVDLPQAIAGKSLHDLDDLLVKIEHWENVHPTRSDDPAYLVYTSGTSSRPKGVLHAHRALIGRTPAVRHWFDFRPGDRVLHSGKLNWTYALGTGLMDPFHQGHTVIVHEGQNDASTWPRLIAEHNCTIFIGVPAIFRQILQKTDFCARDVPTLRHCMSAGEHLPDRVLAAWNHRFGQTIYQALGMSECSYYISQDVIDPIRPGSIGRAQPGHDIQILDAELQPVPTNTEGMICIPSDDPGLCLCYWQATEENRIAWRDGWFLTGDFARRDEEGYIWFLGRQDDIINSFGYRISPHEIEHVMKNHPAVGDCVAIGQRISDDRTLIAICVVLAPETQATENDLLHFAEQHLARYKRPRLVHLLHDLPRTKNGKVVRRHLLDMIEGTAAAESSPAPEGENPGSSERPGQ